jgi:hypothetical protein
MQKKALNLDKPLFFFLKKYYNGFRPMNWRVRKETIHMSNNKLLKLILAGTAVGAAAAAYVAYKRQCDEFEAELSDDFDEIEFENDEPAERTYSSISLDETEADAK